MTNGEKIIETFPNEDGVLVQGVACVYYGTMRFDTTWWNAEYKEQEPCDDLISREYVLALLENKKRTRKEITNRIYEVPSVTQKPKYWIDKDNKIYKMSDDIPTMTIQYPTITHGDTISRTEVMKVISDFVTFEKYIDKHNHITFEPLEKMINALPSVTQKSGKWIPVSERLPEENETVLINYCRLNEHSVRMAIWDELHCRFYNSEYTKYVSVDFVTAWMPLPKPYEPQESEDKE